MKKFSFISLLLAFVIAFSSVSYAAEEKQNEIVVYYPFGFNPYIPLTKKFNEALSKELNVPVRFEFGLLGKAAKVTMQNKPDGKTVYFAAMGPLVLKPNMVKPDILPSDFKAIGRATLLPIVLVARKQAPYKTFDEFMDYARKNPGKVRVAITNVPSSLQIGMTYFVQKLAKLDVQLISQPNAPIDGTIDCLIGETDALISHTPDIMRFINHGDFVPLVTFNETRLEMLPDVPTLKEKGYDFSQTSWRVLLVHKDTPKDIVDRLEKASQKALESAEVQKSAKENYEIISWLSSEDTDKFLQDEFKFYEDLSKSLGLHYSQKKK